MSLDASFETPALSPRVYIYGLVDPETNDIRYVGKTTKLRARVCGHLNDKSRCHRASWIQGLKAKGLEPRVVVLEEIEGAWPWQEAERYWIAHAKRQGWPLTNGTSGGDGVRDLSAEGLARIRTAWIGRKHSAETKRKIGAQSKTRRWTDARRDRMRQQMVGREITWGAKISEASRKLTDEQGREIIRRLAAGEMQKDLAAEFGVHRGTIQNIAQGRYCWAHLHEAPR